VPCDQINTASVVLSNADPKLVASAMAKLYPGVRYELNGQELTVIGRGSRSLDIAEVKREMSRQTVLAQAKRFGWSVKEQPDGKLLIQKARL
jgi:hypothetical protein